MDLSRVSKKSPHEDSRMTLSAIDCKTMDNYNNYYNTLPDKKKLLAQLIRKKNSSRTKYSNEYHELSKKIKPDECLIKLLMLNDTDVFNLTMFNLHCYISVIFVN